MKNQTVIRNAVAAALPPNKIFRLRFDQVKGAEIGRLNVITEAWGSQAQYDRIAKVVPKLFKLVPQHQRKHVASVAVWTPAELRESDRSQKEIN